MKPPSFKKVMAIELTIAYTMIQAMLFYQEDVDFPMTSSETLRKIGWGCYFMAVLMIMSHGLSSVSTEIPQGRDENFKASILIGCPLGLVMVKITGETVQTIASAVKRVAKPFRRNKFLICVGLVTLFAVVITGSALFSYYNGWSYMTTFGSCFAQFVTGEGLCLAVQNLMDTEEGYFVAQVIFLLLAFIAFGYGLYAFVTLCMATSESSSEEEERKRMAEYTRTLLPLYGGRNQVKPMHFCNCAEYRQSEASALLTAPAQPHRTKASLSKLIVRKSAQLRAPYLTKHSLSQIIKKTANPDHIYLTKADLSEPVDEKTALSDPPYLTKADLSNDLIDNFPQPHRLYLKMAPLPREIVHQPHITKEALSQDITEKTPL